MAESADAHVWGACVSNVRVQVPSPAPEKDSGLDTILSLFQLYPFLAVTDDIADTMIYASHIIYASRMKIGTDIIFIFAPQIYHTCAASISYSHSVYIILHQQYIIDKHRLFSIISVPYSHGWYSWRYDICFAYDIRFAYENWNGYNFHICTANISHLRSKYK